MVESTAACLVLKNDDSKNGNSEKHASQFTQDCGKLQSAKHFRVKLYPCKASMFSAVFLLCSFYKA